MREADPSVPIVRLRDMNGVFDESIRRPRLLAQLLGGFAGLALLLAAIGTYGVLSYMVAERRREIGIRMALGADQGSVLGAGDEAGPRAHHVGIVVGLAGAFALNRLIRVAAVRRAADRSDRRWSAWSRRSRSWPRSPAGCPPGARRGWTEHRPAAGLSGLSLAPREAHDAAGELSCRSTGTARDR